MKNVDVKNIDKFKHNLKLCTASIVMAGALMTVMYPTPIGEVNTVNKIVTEERYEVNLEFENSTSEDIISFYDNEGNIYGSVVSNEEADPFLLESGEYYLVSDNLKQEFDFTITDEDLTIGIDYVDKNIAIKESQKTRSR